jgi:hypothetical protein
MFTINGILWKIKFVHPLDPVLLYKDGKHTLGMCDRDNKTIYLAENLEGSMLRKVLCHEIVHAAMFSYNVYLSIEQEEVIADIIATYGDEIINITNKVFKKLQQL